MTSGRADSMYCRPACRQKAYRRRLATAAPVAAVRPLPAAPPKTAPRSPADELLEAMAPFTAYGTGISQTLYKALCRLQSATRHHPPSPQALDDALARLTSMNPARLKIPPTDEGACLRAALHRLHNQHAQP
ncbi:hypothetical protein [Streptomyces sp. NBC_00102]|uniref:hypothetical protein n=1 Tax=Streptomyces sp. NBC_00102 TaxID=2975652 RepID=UPI00225A0DEF|nr:hypothetical protein [Streptomyces sp. NBC_00102]MCX5401992.1 hypothetical protein [Streptomyces sp. NBC_00102]